MNPTGGDLHVNKWLSQISVAWMQANDDFVADKVFPNIPVTNKSDIYPIYSKDEWFRSEMKERAPSTESAGAGWTVTNGTYTTKEFALHKDISDPVRANADSVFNLDRDATMFLSKQALLNRELKWAAKYFTTGVWGGTDQAGVSSGPGANQFLQWDQTSSDPMKDIRTQMILMAQLTGYRPNTLVISPLVWDAITRNALILDRIKYTQRAVLTTDLLAMLLGLDQVLVPWAVQNTGAEGLTGAYSFIYSKSALLCYTVPNPSIMTPTAGYTFSWKGYLGADAYGGRIKRFRMEHLSSDRVEIEQSFDQQVISSDLGKFFTAAIG